MTLASPPPPSTVRCPTHPSCAPACASPQLARKHKPKAAKQAAAGGPTVISATRDAVYGGGPLTSEQLAENTVVAVLGTLFTVIVLEGIFLAASVGGQRACLHACMHACMHERIESCVHVLGGV